MICKICGKDYQENISNRNERGGTGGFCSHQCYFTNKRNQSIAKNGEIDGMPVVPMKNGYASLRPSLGKTIYAHVYVAEKALGKKLPEGARVHHIDGDRLNNSRDNLVILQNEGEHQTLHMKKRIVDAGGIIGKHLFCGFCGELKEIEEFSIHRQRVERYGRCGWCMVCARLKARESHARRKQMRAEA